MLISHFVTGLFSALVCLQVSYAASLQITYEATDGGVQLKYLIAAPSIDGQTKYPTWIFQPGDGNVLDSFQPDRYQPMMEQLAEMFSVAFVMPELRRNLYVNDLKQYCQLDFYHRITDASALIDSVKQQPFVDSGRLVLFGHSGGGEVVTLTAKTRPDIWGVATYGSGVVSLGETGQRLPIPDEVMNNDCSDPKKYTMRSGRFWHQLFIESKLFASIKSLSLPYLAMFGGADPITPFDQTQERISNKLADMKPNFGFEVFSGLDHDGYAKSPTVFQRIADWSK